MLTDARLSKVVRGDWPCGMWRRERTWHWHSGSRPVRAASFGSLLRWAKTWRGPALVGVDSRCLLLPAETAYVLKLSSQTFRRTPAGHCLPWEATSSPATLDWTLQERSNRRPCKRTAVGTTAEEGGRNAWKARRRRGAWQADGYVGAIARYSVPSVYSSETNWFLLAIVFGLRRPNWILNMYACWPNFSNTSACSLWYHFQPYQILIKLSKKKKKWNYLFWCKILVTM